MLNQGLLEETQALYQEYGSLPALESVGYYQCLQYLKGIKPEGRTIAEGIPGLRSEIELATRQLVKAQRTFMKSQFKNLKHLSKILLPEQEASLLKELQALYSHSPSSRSNP
jgi:tRNA A37 N6-isopentenylltransferase MiaA